MAVFINGGIPVALYSVLRKHYEDFYAGKLLCPCDEECPKNCDGDHFYQLPTEYPPLFKE
uniref:Uncharacterized protein n=1 Tax=viral metagenome TaxID=1070528 RepID=A0A6M3L3D5_9ZZZZ